MNYKLKKSLIVLDKDISRLLRDILVSNEQINEIPKTGQCDLEGNLLNQDEFMRAEFPS